MQYGSKRIELENKVFEMCLNEACRQWCAFLDEAPERKDGEGFAEFYREIYLQKSEEYRNELKESEEFNEFDESEETDESDELEM